MAKLVGGTYGEALYNLALEEGREDQFLEEAQALLTVLEANPELSAVMMNPKIVREEKKSTMDSIFKGKISDELLAFIDLTIEKERYGAINEILSYFISKMKEHKGIGVAFVKTAVTLGEIQKAQIQEKLLETTEYKTMEMNYEVDESLIGGMIIRIGDRVVDSSIRSGLENLERSLQKSRL
ncbi:MAG: ATP synthase F1 subunit delta [Lachnospiraceae bacterium]|nr:ATP synthase F1 subunit delta [Candidatus Merdinaster equi]